LDGSLAIRIIYQISEYPEEVMEMNSGRIRMIVRIIGLMFVCGAILLFMAEQVYVGICFLIVSMLIVLRSFTIREDITWEGLWGPSR